MKFLITGGAGSVGQALTRSLLEKDHSVRVLDKKADQLQLLDHQSFEQIKGEIEDPSAVSGAVKGIDVIVHLAWSFSDEPMELLASDLKGHILLLEAAAAEKVSHFFYTSTAVVYGKPVKSPITEEDPCLVEDARKPFYGIAKLTAEKFLLAYFRSKALPVTIFRFWWSYGEEIGGRHLRDLIKLAQAGEPLTVPDDAGGSFLHVDDLTNALLIALQKPETFGEIFNLSTLFLSWEEVARIIIEVTNSSSPLEVIPAKEWKGAPFLADAWKLSTAKAERVFGYRPTLSPSEARQRLKEAIAQCYRTMKS
ncbi:MAG: NAD-dependent epimerase/dehydratase [Deltaproteobacteria bacterium]|nr:NAD-dependent epimerase/dehydratase [Deltaproteobacteria bacterium]